MSHFLDELRWRGLLHQTTDDKAIETHLAPGAPVRRAYAGFDPTADSLTIGNLIPIKLLMHLQQAGHAPVVLMGGGTGLIGDPSGKSAERQLMTREVVEANVRAQRAIFERLLDFEGPAAARIVNNADWLCDLGYIEALRDIGKHFSVNMMIQKDSVRDRLHAREQGISYTEFSYMILQSYDFLHLRRSMDVSVQLGGSDQWGNIVGGVDLTRRVMQKEVFGLTAPLVTKSDGGKFGKTEEGAIWLTAERTSPYAFYQFWLNTDDADIARFLRFFSVMPQDEVESLIASHEKNPGAREAHRALASHMTGLLHGDAAAKHAQAAASALFSGEVAQLDEKTLDEVFANVPSSDHPRSDLDGEGALLIDLIAETTLAKSRREAKEFLANGSVSVNGEKVAANKRLTTEDLLHGRVALLRRGKKTWHVTRWR